MSRERAFERAGDREIVAQLLARGEVTARVPGFDRRFRVPTMGCRPENRRKGQSP